jgi:hypothetical protein
VTFLSQEITSVPFVSYDVQYFLNLLTVWFTWNFITTVINPVPKHDLGWSFVSCCVGGQLWNIIHSPYKWSSLSLNGMVTSSRNRNWEVISPGKITDQIICLDHKFRVFTFPGKLTFAASEIGIYFSFRVLPGLLAPTSLSLSNLNCPDIHSCLLHLIWFQEEDFNLEVPFPSESQMVPVSFCQPELKASPVILVHSSSFALTSMILSLVHWTGLRETTSIWTGSCRVVR